jgi:hypothetical protein
VAESFVRPIKDGLEMITELVPAELHQPYDGIVLLEAEIAGVRRPIAIDYGDWTSVNLRCAESVNTYFKLQHLRDGYPNVDNVVPGGYVANLAFLYAHWCRLRALRQNSPFASEVFGRFGLRWGAHLREAAMNILRDDPRIDFSGGVRPTRHSRYLREMARSRVCLDLPGQGPFCCRMVEGLAIGACIIATRHATVLPTDLRAGVEIVYCQDDLSDLADLCEMYVFDDTKREPVEMAAAKYFDENLHPVRLAEHYLNTLTARA